MSNSNQTPIGTLGSGSAIHIRDWSELTNKFQTILMPAVQEMLEKLRPFAASLMHIAQNFRKIELLEESGWLPHRTTPFEIYCHNNTADEVRDLMCAYYCENWTAIRRNFASSPALEVVDESARGCFAEALACHGSGYFRSVPRLLFPELERVARVELPTLMKRGAVSLEGIRRAIGDESLAEVLPEGLRSTNLFRNFVHHIYQSVMSEEDVSRIVNHPVPNRHSAIHGSIVYCSPQSSINTIIIAEYLFQLVGILKAARSMG